MRVQTKARVNIGDLKNVVGSSLTELRDNGEIEVKATVDAGSVAAEIGYRDPEAVEAEMLASVEPDLRDLADGLKALIAGDRSMARILLDRAFDDWPDARRVVEEVIRGGRVDPDPRQLSLAA